MSAARKTWMRSLSWQFELELWLIVGGHLDALDRRFSQSASKLDASYRFSLTDGTPEMHLKAPSGASGLMSSASLSICLL